MAPGVEVGFGSRSENHQVFGEFHAATSQILRRIFSESSVDVTQDLSVEIDEQELWEDRKTVFTYAMRRYKSQVEAYGVDSNGLKLDLIHRTKDVELSLSRDIVHLLLYVCGEKDKLPKGVLCSKSVNTYVDITLMDTNHGEPGEMNIDELKSTVRTMTDRCEKYERSLMRVWEYIYSLEKVQHDELKDINGKFTKYDTAINELKGDGICVGGTVQTAMKATGLPVQNSTVNSQPLIQTQAATMPESMPMPRLNQGQGDQGNGVSVINNNNNNADLNHSASPLSQLLWSTPEDNKNNGVPPPPAHAPARHPVPKSDATPTNVTSLSGAGAVGAAGSTGDWEQQRHERHVKITKDIRPHYTAQKRWTLR